MNPEFGGPKTPEYLSADEQRRIDSQSEQARKSLEATKEGKNLLERLKVLARMNSTEAIPIFEINPGDEDEGTTRFLAEQTKRLLGVAETPDFEETYKNGNIYTARRSRANLEPGRFCFEALTKKNGHESFFAAYPFEQRIARFRQRG